MPFHFQDTSWLPLQSSFRGQTPPSSESYSARVDAFATKASQLFHESNLLTGAFLISFSALLWRILVNWNATRCLSAKSDILVALKTLFGVVYIAGAVEMVFYDTAEWILLSTGVATAVAFLAASVSEHYHSIAPSTVTSLCAVSGTAFYTYMFLGRHCDAAAAAAVSMFVLIFLESKSKRGLLKPSDPVPAHESTLSFLVKPFFPHLLPILFTGYRRRITLPELRDIPLHLQADPATDKLLAALAIEDQTSSRYLVKSTLRAFGGHFLSPIFPRLLVLAGTFAQVSLVEQMVLYVSDKSIPKEHGIQLMAAYLVVYVSLAISNYVYSEKVNAFMVLYRSALTGSLYAKTLRLMSMAARELGQGAATTYMSVDVEKVTMGFQTLQNLWAAVLTIIIACAMLWVKAGYVMFAPLVFVIILLGTTSFISRFVGVAHKVWLKAMDVRIKLLTSVLGQLLPIKLGAYETPLEGKINTLRKLETEALKRFMYGIAVAGSLSLIGGTASFLLTLVAYTVMLAQGWGDLPPLDASRLFALFTIVNLLNGPLIQLGQMLPTIFAAFASLGRIQGFLQLPEKTESGAALDTSLVDVSSDGVKPSNVEVSLDGCTFAWDEKTHVLQDITVELVPHALHMIVGSVASGKSSLLMSILGETTLVAGKLKVRAQKIALAGQTSFIYPGTLRANILLDSPFDEVFYNRVIHACGLRQDIEALPRRDLTKLGDKGATLSGGQRQRLAIARAVYARADLVMLDDVFSALDGETEAHVFASLFGPDGMLKEKTTVLVTHGVHHLSSADRVIIMDTGKIVAFGSFVELRDAGETLHAIALIAFVCIRLLSNKPRHTFALASAGDVRSGPGQLAEESATAATVVDEEEEEELNWTNEQTSRRGAYTFYMKCTGVLRAYGLFVLIVIWGLAGVLTTAFLAVLTSFSGDHIDRWVAAYAAIVLIHLVSIAFTLAYFAYTLSSFTAPRIHGAELAGVLGSPISWITKNPAGKILNRFSQDIQVADQDFPFAFINFSTCVMGAIGTFAFITIATPLLVVALPVLAVGGAYLLRFYLASSKQFRRLELGSRSPLYTLFGTTVSGLITVRAYSAQDFFQVQNAAFVNESQGALHHRLAGQLFLRVFLLWCQAILASGVALLTVWFRDTTSAAFLGIALSSLVSLAMELDFLISSWASVENGSVAIDRIEEFSKLPEEEKNALKKIRINEQQAWPSTGSLNFADFSMKYRDDLPLALKNLTFDLKGGLKIGICGRTGSGKSSTVLSLFRGVDQHLVTGKIFIDGIDISTIPLKQLRDSMSIVTQDPFLWHGSIRENLDVINACTDSEIWEALKSVEMYDAVSALDDKLDHLVVDEESFSKGQRQLLCLARALLRKKKIVVLDESTSSMDHITNEKIRHVVNTQMKGLTVVAIAHRISTIVDYDKILVLDRGSIAEFDAPTVLLSNPESRFARLAATQGIYHPDLVPKDTAVKPLGDGTVLVTEDLIDF
ncbi:P-loop containing nucleoside triphosphate hydrolase protein [Mycena crocata]|nr:P-loop containing nucleoside triphosphate hydrolase protein [Mycena crocata]